MIPATQADVNEFYRKVMNDEKIYPWLGTSQWVSIPKVEDDDWGSKTFISPDKKCLLHIIIQRTQCNGLTFSVYSMSPYWAGRCIAVVKEYAKRYNSRHVESCVHASNQRSLKMTERLLGAPWGREPMGAWNSKTGKWEDLVHFKRVLN